MLRGAEREREKERERERGMDAKKFSCDLICLLFCFNSTTILDEVKKRNKTKFSFPVIFVKRGRLERTPLMFLEFLLL